MPTTFNVVSLGVQADLDTAEGNTLAENASALVGLTFGGIQDSLVNDFQELTPGTNGGGTPYDQDNTVSNDTFFIDGGAAQTFDSSVIYNATITYIDGTSVSITAVIFQDTAGNTYWAPEFSASTDQTAMQADAIRSLTLDSLSGATFSGLTASRETWNFADCYVNGTLIETETGEIPVERLKVGDRVVTASDGLQPVRWIGRNTRVVTPELAPIRIRKNALGCGYPRRDLLVSPRNRMLVRSVVAERVCGSRDVLVAAKKLLELPGVEVADDFQIVTYVHIMLDAHHIVFAEGALSETLFLGEKAAQALGPDALDEIYSLFPELATNAPEAMLPIPTPKNQKKIAYRLAKNAKPAFDTPHVWLAPVAGEASAKHLADCPAVG